MRKFNLIKRSEEYSSFKYLELLYSNKRVMSFFFFPKRGSKLFIELIFISSPISFFFKIKNTVKKLINFIPNHPKPEIVKISIIIDLILYF